MKGLIAMSKKMSLELQNKLLTIISIKILSTKLTKDNFFAIKNILKKIYNIEKDEDVYSKVESFITNNNLHQKNSKILKQMIDNNKGKPIKQQLTENTMLQAYIKTISEATLEELHIDKQQYWRFYKKLRRLKKRGGKKSQEEHT